MRTCRLPLIEALIAALLACASTAAADVIVVPDDQATIQAAIDAAAAAGDTVLIRPGTFHESLVMVAKSVSLIGESGAGSTTISGGDTARVLALGTGVDTTTTIRGLHFERGRSSQGGAIEFVDGASARILDCRFTRHVATRGGALYVAGPSNVRVEDCEFSNNAGLAGSPGGTSWGGAVYATGATAIVFLRSEFTGNSAQGFEGGPGGTAHLYDSRVTFELCTIRNGFGLVGGIYSSYGSLTVRNSTFDSNTVGYGASAIFSQLDTVEIVGNLVFGGYSIGEGAFHAEFATGTIASNTITKHDGHGLRYHAYGDLLVTNNLVANNTGVGISCDAAPTGTLTCNNVWGNGTDWGNHCDLGSGDNTSFDPLFCDPANGDYTLSASSPCAPEASACGLIGALPVACAAVSVATVGVPAIASLQPVRPNPANSMVAIHFTIGRPGAYTLEIIDVAGRRFATLASGWMNAGPQARAWPTARSPGRRVAPGAYFAVLRGAGVRRTQRFVVLD